MTWADDMRALHANAGGLLELHVLRAFELPAVYYRFACGDQEAGALIAAARHTLKQIKCAPVKRRMLCACCPRPLLPRTPFAIVVATPHRRDPASALSLAVCERCAIEPDEIRAKAMSALKRIWPDGRMIEVHPGPAGHA